MIRTLARLSGLALTVALAQACSRANASGRTGDRAVARDTAASAAAPAPAAPAAPAPPAHDWTLAAGRPLSLRMVTGLTSRHNHAGDAIEAVAVTAAVSATGDTVIPAGAPFHGTVREIAAAPNPHAQGHLVLAFTEVRVGDALRPIDVRVTEMPTRLQGRGVTGGTVAKVGAGALVGGLAGRLIGRSGTGTVIGAAAGAAAGGVYANATRNLDVVLPAGSVVHVTITAPFDREVAAK